MLELGIWSVVVGSAMPRLQKMAARLMDVVQPVQDRQHKNFPADVASVQPGSFLNMDVYQTSSSSSSMEKGKKNTPDAAGAMMDSWTKKTKLPLSSI